MEKFDEKDGVWRTIGGRRVFIRTGQSLSDAMRESGKFKTKSGKVRKEDSSKEVKEENADKKEKNYREIEKQLLDDYTKVETEDLKEYRDIFKEQGKEKFAERLQKEIDKRESVSKEGNKYKATKREGFGSYNDDYVPVYDNKIDYTGDFSGANLSKLSDEELTKALSKQSELYNQATNERIGDQRTRNGKMDKIFNTAKKQQYEKGMTKLNEEMQKRNLPRYNIYNESNGLLMVSSPTKEMAERQLKDMAEIDKSLQKEYGWKELPKYSVKEETKNGKEIEQAMFSNKSTNETMNEAIREKASKTSKKERIEELRNKFDKEQNIFKKAEISEEIHMLQDDFKGTREEYRKQIEKEQEKRLRQYQQEKEKRQKEIRNQLLQDNVKNLKTQKGLKSMADNGLATDITRYDDKQTKALREKHGSLEKVKILKGVYGMNGALLRSRETGEYFVITSRNSNLFYWV